MASCLFVRGFATYGSPTDQDKNYAYLELVLRESFPDFSFFSYSPEEDLDDVYQRLCARLRRTGRKGRQGGGDVLVAHSLGGCLVTKWLAEHPGAHRRFRRVVLLMPFLSRTPVGQAVSRVVDFLPAPLARRPALPVPLLTPAGTLCDSGNVWTDLTLCTHIVPFGQIVTAYRDQSYLMPAARAASVLNAATNVRVLRADDDSVAPLDPRLVNDLTHITSVPGKHECYNDCHRATLFFRALRALL